MKYILTLLLTLLLIGFVFGQEEIQHQDLKSKPLLDFTLETPADKCFKILIEFQDGWFENIFNEKDLCPNMIDVRIEYEGIIQDYTMEEFLTRLGFKE